MSGTVINFHYVNVMSKGSSQMQHLQHNFKVTIDLTLNYVKIFEFQIGSPRKLTYNKVYHLFGLWS